MIRHWSQRFFQLWSTAIANHKHCTNKKEKSTGQVHTKIGENPRHTIRMNPYIANHRNKRHPKGKKPSKIMEQIIAPIKALIGQ